MRTWNTDPEAKIYLIEVPERGGRHNHRNYSRSKLMKYLMIRTFIKDNPHLTEERPKIQTVFLSIPLISVPLPKSPGFVSITVPTKTP